MNGHGTTPHGSHIPTRAEVEWDEWLTLFADRNDVAEEYARQIQAGSFTNEWFAGFNAAIVRRWSKSGLSYIKTRAWKIAADG